MLIPEHPEWEQQDQDSKHHQGLQAFAQHLGAQFDGAQAIVKKGPGVVAQRMSDLAGKIHDGAAKRRIDLQKIIAGKF